MTAADDDYERRYIASAEEYAQLVRDYRRGKDVNDFEIAATALSLVQIFNVSPRTVADALSLLLPGQREFWLRVEATLYERFMGGMTHLLTEEPDT